MEPETQVNCYMEQNREQESEDDYSSFDSHQEEVQSDQKSPYSYHGYYKQRGISLPEVPTNLPKLYQIYLQNENRKKDLKNGIKNLIQKQLKMIRVQYDQKTSAIEQFIDTQQISEQYKGSKKNYQNRKTQLINSGKQYQKLKIKQIQTIIHNTENMKKLLLRYSQQNKEIVNYYFYRNQVRVLTKEKRNIRTNALHKKIKNDNQDAQSQSHVSSEDHQFASKYLVRGFKFYYSKDTSQIAFQPNMKPLELPKAFMETTNQNIQYKGLTYCPINNITVTYDKESIYTFKGPKMIANQTIGNAEIIFVEIKNYQLFVGTTDGVLRIFKVLENADVQLEKIVGCYLDQYQIITHFSLTNSPEIVLFVENGKKLCMVNTTTYSNYLVTDLNDKIVKLTPTLLTTATKVYPFYYSINAGQIKATLIDLETEKLTENISPKNIIQLTELEQKLYFICDMGNGEFIVKEFVA